MFTSKWQTPPEYHTQLLWDWIAKNIAILAGAIAGLGTIFVGIWASVGWIRDRRKKK